MPLPEKDLEQIDRYICRQHPGLDRIPPELNYMNWPAINTLPERVAVLETRLDGLRDKMDRQFEQVDKRFEQVDKRFEQVDRRFEQMDRRFEQVDKRFSNQNRAMVAGFAFVSLLLTAFKFIR